jgi:hypothetical protein
MNVTVKLSNGQWEIIGLSLDHNHDLVVGVHTIVDKVLLKPLQHVRRR